MPELSNVIVWPLRVRTVGCALRPIVYVVPETTATVGWTVMVIPFCVIVEKGRVAAWRGE